MLSAVEIIIKKRSGSKLNKVEISSFIENYINGNLPDYQMSSLLMAIYFQNMDEEEVQHLTETYINSGRTLSFTENTVDKHSTGGIGDKISLMLAPIVAECGAYIPMISGRGLGHTGGTLDKLEAIPGFKTDLSETEFRNVIKEVGFSIISQSNELVPADKKIYALRDVTGTVESLPLITASIISKKIAEGAKNLVIDLKVGTGAFIPDFHSGKELGRLLKNTGERLGQKVEIVYSNMNSPIGNYVGNGLEVLETIEYLQGKDIPDIDLLTKHLAVKMLILAGVCHREDDAMERVTEAVKSGKALQRFAKFIKAQGGNEKVCADTGLLPQAKYTIPIKAVNAGWIKSINCRLIGYALLNVEAGRKNLNSRLDHTTGAYLEPKVGDYLSKDDIIGKVFCNDKEMGTLTAEIIASSYDVTDLKVDKENMLL